MPESFSSLAALRLVAAAGSLAGSVDGASRPAAGAIAGDWLTGGLARGRLHDVYAAEDADGAAAIGFAVALALAAGALPILWVRHERDERRAGRLHAGGLIELGLPADALVLVVAADAAAGMRVAVDAARCPGLGMLLLETRGPAPELDLIATRRLMLAAERSAVTAMSVRIGAAAVPSAAATRWAVAAIPSRRLAAQAPGPPAFAVECLRRRGGPAGACHRVEWNRETRCFVPAADPVRAAPSRGDGRFAGQAAALAGAGLSLAAGGSPAYHPAASVRRAG